MVKKWAFEKISLEEKQETSFFESFGCSCFIVLCLWQCDFVLVAARGKARRGEEEEEDDEEEEDKT